MHFSTVTLTAACSMHLYVYSSTCWEDGWSFTKNNQGSKRHDIKGQL